VSKSQRMAPDSSPAAARALAPVTELTAGAAAAAATATTATTIMSSMRVKPLVLAAARSMRQGFTMSAFSPSPPGWPSAP
jgi:hypothetical protein